MHNRHANIETIRHIEDVFFDTTHEGILITDLTGIIETVNPAFTLMSGYTLEEVKGKTPGILKAGRHDEGFYQEMWMRLKKGERWNGKVWNRRKNGEIFSAELIIEKALPRESEEYKFVGLYTELSESPHAATLMKHRDPLTNLPDRMLLRSHLSFMIAHGRRNNVYVALLLLDLDRFKKVNDSLGYSAGDSILISFSGRLKNTLRESDTVFRLGNDEFAIIIDEVHKIEDTAKVAKKVLELFNEPFTVPRYENDLYLSGSIGISVFPQDGLHAEDLIKNAETAMYQAKEIQQNSFQHYSPTMNASSFKYLAIEHQLYKALERDEFKIYYQPIVDLRTEEIVALEALVRWSHPELGLISPGDFIPIAEETGLIVQIGEVVLKQACEKIKQLHEKGFPKLHMSVNLSGRQFQLPDLVERIKNILSRTGLSPSFLELEITESVGMQDVHHTATILGQLKLIGSMISIDDFGTGYSSLNYLRRFPVDRLKIAQAFIRDLGDAPDCESIVALIIDMAHTLKLSVVAEGVETHRQLFILKDHQCDCMQGFIFSKPVPPDDIERFLINGRAGVQ